MTLPSPVVGGSEASAAPVAAVASSRRRALRRLMHDGASVFLGTRTRRPLLSAVAVATAASSHGRW